MGAGPRKLRIGVLEVRQPDIDRLLERAHGGDPLVSAGVVHDRDGEPLGTGAGHRIGQEVRELGTQQVTRLMLWAPCSWSSSMICTKRPGSTSTPAKLPVEISWFWQYTHFSGQPEKNRCPNPRSPDIGGSSHMCSAARAMRKNRPRRRPPRTPRAIGSAPTRAQGARIESSGKKTAIHVSTCERITLFARTGHGHVHRSSSFTIFRKSRLVLEKACPMMKLFRPTRSNWVNRRVYLGSPHSRCRYRYPSL